jgi:hypothetical protein
MTPIEWIQQMIDSNREALGQMPFPMGMTEYVEQLVHSGQTEELINLMKFGFLMGLQQSGMQEVPAETRIQA